MPTFIKAGFWEQLCTPCKGYKGWLNLDELIQKNGSHTSGTSGTSGTNGAQGAQGQQGIQGIQGIQGPPGGSFTILGSYPTYADFLAGAGGSPGSSIGDAYTILDNSHLYVWNGSVWFDAGPLTGPQGPVGPQGVSGTSGTSGTSGSSGSSGSAGTSGTSGANGAVGGKYGSFYDTTDQVGGSIRPFTLNTTDFSNGVSIVNGSEITFNTIGKFNIAFSAQLIKTGGTSTNIWIWLRHNGVDVPYSATSVEMGNNNVYNVAAWNFFIDVNTNPQQFQLMWYTPSANVSIGTIPDASTPAGVPAVPSIILTVNQVG